MAAANTTSMSGLYADNTKWLAPSPPWDQVLDLVGGDAVTNAPDAKKAVLNLAARSPTVIAFVLAEDPSLIHIGHSLSVFNNDPLTANPYDDTIIAFVGNDLASAAPIMLPADCFKRTTANVTAYNTTHMTGALGHGAVPPVYRFDHVGTGTAETDDIRARCAMVLPADDAADFLGRQPSGIYTLQHFYTTFLQPHVGSAVQATVDKWQPITNWWRCACMKVNGSQESRVQLENVVSGSPAATQALNACLAKIRERELARVGVGGPQLSNAAFNTGVLQLQTTLNDNAMNRLQFERDKAQKTFTDKFGDHLATHMYKMTGAADDDHLPEVHKVLARAPKGQFFAVLASYVQARAQTSPLPVFSGCLPVLTTKLVDQVFRAFQVCGIGNLFGEGLSPFSVCCEGHAEYQKVVKRTRQAELAFAGNNTSMADAADLTTVDTRYPTTPQHAAEKLYGWSILVDVFHGENTAVAKNVREAVHQIGPRMHSIHAGGGSNAVGMDLCNKVLYDLQQTYFDWAEQTALCTDIAALPRAPTFEDICQAVRTNRFYNLSPLPMSWYTMVDNPAPGGPTGSRAPSSSAGNDTSPRHQSGSVPVFNSNADQDMMTRFRDSGHRTIKDMMEGKNATIPKHQNKPVCLVWALKRECSSNCKRKDMHIRYPATVNKAIHTFLDKCDVASLQG